MHPDDAKAGNNNLKLGWQILGHFGHIQPKRNLPTPTVDDQFTDGLKSTQQSDGSLHSVSLAQIVHRADLIPNVQLLPTPMANEGEKATNKQNAEQRAKTGQVMVTNVAQTIQQQSSWGQFQPAIERWEQVIGRPAPEPTEPTGKNGSHRLSAKFTEFMMGLEEGHITDPAIGISRNDQLKACGNGVVPQQAMLALKYLLERREL